MVKANRPGQTPDSAVHTHTSGLGRMDTVETDSPTPRRQIRVFALPGHLNTKDGGGRTDRGVRRPIDSGSFRLNQTPRIDSPLGNE